MTGRCVRHFMILVFTRDTVSSGDVYRIENVLFATDSLTGRRREPRKLLGLANREMK